MVPNQMRSSRNPSIAYFIFHLLECKGRVLLDKSPLRFFGPVSNRAPSPGSYRIRKLLVKGFFFCPGVRHFSSKPCSVDRAELIQEIEDVYEAFAEGFASVRPCEVTNAILSGSFKFSPLPMTGIPKKEVANYTYQFWSIPQLPDIAFVTVPVDTDRLVFLAFVRFLSKRLQSVFLETAFGLVCILIEQDKIRLS